MMVFSGGNVLLRVDMLHFLFPERFPTGCESSEDVAAIFGGKQFEHMHIGLIFIKR